MSIDDGFVHLCMEATFPKEERNYISTQSRRKTHEFKAWRQESKDECKALKKAEHRGKCARRVLSSDDELKAKFKPRPVIDFGLDRANLCLKIFPF